MRAAAMLDAVSGVAQAQVHQTGRIDTSAEQGGRVDVLADHGLVRVSGSINSNSTPPVLLASAAPVGGEIFIGRDDQTQALAHVGDVRGAQLESKGGFVETSGDHLVTDGVRVTAKDWLLDPTDVEIVASGEQLTNGSFANEDGTSTFLPTPNGNSTNPSRVSKDTINAALNDGTNVTIQTVSNNNQKGNITVSAAIVKSVDVANKPLPTLTLKADGGIFINENIGATAGSLSLDLQAKNGGVVIKDGVAINLNQGTLSTDVKVSGTDTGFVVGTAAGNGATINAKQVNIHTNTVSGAGLVLADKSTITVSEGIRITAKSSDAAGGNIELLGTITNTGTGDIVLAAGSNREAGYAQGGQVKTAAGKAIDTKGKVYIYTGNAKETGKLTDLVESLGELRLSDIGAAKQNADTNRKFEDTNRLDNGTTAQVYFRDKVALDLKFNDKITYGDDTSTAFGAAKLNATLNDTDQHSIKLNAGDFKIALKAVVASLNATEVNSAVDALKKDPNLSTSKNLKAGVYGNKSEAPLNLGSNKYGGIRGELEVLRKNLIISGVKVEDKEYDGTKTATVDTSATLSFNGLVSGDQVQVGALSAAFVDKNVGTNKDVNLGEASVTGVDLLNYNITTPQKTNANITQNTTAKVVLTGKSDSKVYSGTNQSVTGLTATGLLGEDVDNNGGVTASTSGRNAGTYTETVFANLADLEKNYKKENITTQNGTLTITKNKTADVVLTGNSDSKVYNGTTQSVTGFTVTGLIGDDTAGNIGGKASTSGKDVGVYTKTVFTELEALRNNYEKVSTKEGQLDITQNVDAVVKLKGKTATQEYNGTTQSVTGLTASGLLGTDTADNIGAKASTSGKDVGSYDGTVFTDLESVKKNYKNVTTEKGQLTITQNTTAKVVLAGNTGTTNYNGKTQSVTGLDANKTSGLLGDDKFDNIGVTASTSGKDAGTYTNTAFANLAALEKNYKNITTQNGALTISKSQAEVTIKAKSATNEYNGFTQILEGLEEVKGLLGDDAINPIDTIKNLGVTARASGKNVGEYETAFDKLENLLKNYEKVDLVKGRLKITPNTTTTVTLTGASGSTLFNGNTQSVSGVTATGLVGEDEANNAGVTSTASGVQVGDYTSEFTGLEQVRANYANVVPVPGTLTIVAVSPEPPAPPAPPEPPEPPEPPAPPEPPQPVPEPEPEGPATPGGPNSGRTSVRLADANPFNLAGLDDEPVCSIDNLSACYCEKALDEEERPLERLNVCMPEKPEDTGRATKAPQA